MVIDDSGTLNVSIENVMPRILNGAEHLAVFTCGEDLRVLVTIDFAEATFDKPDK
jgi:hypothetical protein